MAIRVAGFSLFEAVLTFFQFPGTGVGLAMGLLPIGRHPLVSEA